MTRAEASMAIGVLGIVVLAAIGVAWHRNTIRQSPQFAAFSTTFAAILFTVTGLAGFGLQRGTPLFSEARAHLEKVPLPVRFLTRCHVPAWLTSR
jgi:hypothetical protein